MVMSVELVMEEGWFTMTDSENVHPSEEVTLKVYVPASKASKV